MVCISARADRTMDDGRFIWAMIRFLIGDDFERKRLIVVTAYALGALVLGAILLKGEFLAFWFVATMLAWLVAIRWW